MSSTAVPISLARYCVAQDYAQYDAADQATWRFVLLHLLEHLKEHAHPSYVAGLGAAGMRVERIPTIAEMNAALEKFGWRAACVTGFIPPRAFQAFQAEGILPIAAEIRSPEHLAYTPAPDIIHEAAGHAPLLVDAEYASYLREIGQTGRYAFSSAEDQAVYRAILRLSQVKEQPASTPEQQERARLQLQTACENQTRSSEASRLARLYWWTAEYGLIGSLQDFRLYGAGLLSSLGEAHYCRAPAVVKRPLDVTCLDVDYDITRPQPQLFVTPDFSHLREVLSEARRQLSALGSLTDAACGATASALPCRVRFEGDFELAGTLRESDSDGERLRQLTFRGTITVGLPERSQWLGEGLRVSSPDLRLLLGETWRLKSGGSSSIPITQIEWERIELGSVLELTSNAGQSMAARFLGLARKESGSAICLHLGEATMINEGSENFYNHYIWPLTAPVQILPGDDETDDMDESSPKTAPAPRHFTASQHELRALYAAASAAWQARTGSTPLPVFKAIIEHLKNFPDDWLLRWNLLESLLKLGECDNTHSLFDELELLEIKHAEQQPIATGLRSLRRLGQFGGQGYTKGQSP